VWDLFEYTRENMPQDDPGSLDDETYADIVAYVLSENDFPEGGDELGPDREDAMRDMNRSTPMRPTAKVRRRATRPRAPGRGGQTEGDQARTNSGRRRAPADEADEGAETAEAQDGEGEPTEDEAAGDRDDATKPTPKKPTPQKPTPK
jgi:hypothetical protein